MFLFSITYRILSFTRQTILAIFRNWAFALGCFEFSLLLSRHRAEQDSIEFPFQISFLTRDLKTATSYSLLLPTKHRLGCKFTHTGNTHSKRYKNIRHLQMEKSKWVYRQSKSKRFLFPFRIYWILSRPKHRGSTTIVRRVQDYIGNTEVPWLSG